MTGVWVTLRLDLADARQSLDALEQAVDDFAAHKPKIEVEAPAATGASAPAVARAMREVDRAEEHALQRMIRRRALQRAIRRRALQRVAARSAGRAGGAAAEGAAIVGRSAATVTRSSPLGWIVGAAVVAGIATMRLLTGAPLEGTGEMINRILLGDEDDKARANRRTREWLEGSPMAMRFLGQEGPGALTQIQQVAKSQETVFLREEIGAAHLREAFPVNGSIDMMILAMAAAFRTEWKNRNGGQSLIELREAYNNYLREYAASAHG